MELKYIIFFFILLIGVPVGTLACTLFRPVQKLVFIFMVWATSVPDLAGINFFSRELYRMNTRGIEVSIVDICALILFFTMLLNTKREHKFRWFPALTIPYLLYILISLISWSAVTPEFRVPDETHEWFAKVGISDFYQTFETKLYPAFTLSKMLRGGFIYLVVVNYIRTEEAIRTAMLAFLVTTLYVTMGSLVDRYIYGIYRVAFTLGHPNTLATYMAMMFTLMFGVVLQSHQTQAKESPRDTVPVDHPATPAGNIASICRFIFTGLSTGHQSRTWLAYAFATACAGGTVLLTLSRGGLAGMVWGSFMVICCLLYRFLTYKNLIVLTLGALLAALAILTAADSLTERFFREQDATADLEYRELYNKEARLMAKEHPFGVGMGNFSAWSWRRYGDLVGIDTPGTPAHNIWYLTLAEVGIPGLAAFAIYWLCYYAHTIKFLFQNRKDYASNMATVCVIATLVCQWQNMLQLGYRQSPMYFFNKILIGISMAVWYMQREQKKQIAASDKPAEKESLNPLQFILSPLALFGLAMFLLFAIKYFAQH